MNASAGVWEEVYCCRNFPQPRSDQRTGAGTQSPRAHLAKITRHYRAAYVHKFTGEVRFSGFPFHVCDWSVRRKHTSTVGDPSSHRTGLVYFNVTTGCERSFRWASPGPLSSAAEEQVRSNRTESVGIGVGAYHGRPQWIALHDPVTGQAFYSNTRTGKCVWTHDHAADFAFEEVDLFGQEDKVQLPEAHAPSSTDGGADLRYSVLNHVLGLRLPLHRFEPRRLEKARRLLPRAAFLAVRPPESLKQTQASPLVYAKQRSVQHHWQIQHRSRKPWTTAQAKAQHETQARHNSHAATAARRRLEAETADTVYAALHNRKVSRDVARIRVAILGKHRKGDPVPSVALRISQAEARAAAEIRAAAAEDRAAARVKAIVAEHGSCWRRVFSEEHERYYYVQFKPSDTRNSVESGEREQRSGPTDAPEPKYATRRPAPQQSESGVDINEDNNSSSARTEDACAKTAAGQPLPAFLDPSHSDQLEALDPVDMRVLPSRAEWRLPPCPAGYRVCIARDTGVVSWHRKLSRNSTTTSLKSELVRKLSSRSTSSEPRQSMSSGHSSFRLARSSRNQVASAGQSFYDLHQQVRKEASAGAAGETIPPPKLGDETIRVVYDPMEVIEHWRRKAEKEAAADEVRLTAEESAKATPENMVNADSEEDDSLDGKFNLVDTEDDEDEEDGGYLAALMNRPRRASQKLTAKTLALSPRTKYVRSRANTPAQILAATENDYNSDDTDEGGRRFLQHSLRRHRRVVHVDDSDQEDESDEGDDSFASYSD
eukprot:INCI9870.15.p1 GENE.INCI9870.15~~INCI9870.15.p1  ORF type:complete len:771 (-),score=115.02 INCI9870.15:1872-4184(-)